MSEQTQQKEDAQSIIGDMPEIKCKIHQDYKVEMINPNINSNNQLVCMKCIALNDLKVDQIVILEDVYSKDPQKIIKNWPPLQDNKYYELLTSRDLQEDKRNSYILEIKQIFDQFKQDVLKVIDDHQQKMFAHINIIEENRKSVFQTYNEISEREKIKKIIFKNKDYLQYLDNELKTLTYEKQSFIKQNEQKIIDSLHSFAQSTQKLSFSEIANHHQSILENLKSVDFLAPLHPIIIEQPQEEELQIDLQQDLLSIRSYQNLSQFYLYARIHIDLRQKSFRY